MNKEFAPFTLEAQAPLVELTEAEVARISGAGQWSTTLESSHYVFQYYDAEGVLHTQSVTDYDTVDDFDC